MNASHQVYLALSGDAAVAAITDTVRPMRLHQDDALPAVVYQPVSTNAGASLQGDTSNLDHVRMQVDCWAETFTQARDLASAVRDAMRPRTNNLFARFIDERSVYELTNRRYGVSADYYIWQHQH